MRKGVAFFPDWSRDNPYQKLLYTEISRSGIPCQGQHGKDFTVWWLFSNRTHIKYIHLHWLFGIYDPFNNGLTYGKAIKFISKIIFAKLLGYRILRTVHNFLPHEATRPTLENWIRRKTSGLADITIVHCNYAKNLILAKWKVKEDKIRVIPHGSYNGYYLNTISCEDARKLLGVNDDCFIFLFFGMLRDYKGIKPLIQSFQEIQTIKPKTRLIIAGRPFNEIIKREIEETAACNEKISCFLRYVPDEEVQCFFNASDAIVLPYQNVLTSGAAVLALSFGKPVVLPGKGCIPELIDEETGFLYHDKISLREALLRAIRCKSLSNNNMNKKALKIADDLQWGKLVEKYYLPLFSVLDK